MLKINTIEISMEDLHNMICHAIDKAGDVAVRTPPENAAVRLLMADTASLDSRSAKIVIEWTTCFPAQEANNE